MDLSEAIRKRKSIRKFKPESVPKEIIHKILKEALRAPSAINTQPWEFAVVGGETLKKIAKDSYEEAIRGGSPRPEFKVPESWKEIYVKRMRENAKGLFGGVLHIERDNQTKRHAFNLSMYRYFDAPQAIFLCIDESLNWISVFDCGCFIQNLCLLAVSKGLGTCIEHSGVHFPDIIRKHVTIPNEKKILLAIAIGYPDDHAPINQFRSHRESLEKFIIYLSE